MISNSSDDYKDIEPFSQVFKDIVDNSFIKEGIEFDIYIYSMKSTSA